MLAASTKKRRYQLTNIAKEVEGAKRSRTGSGSCRLWLGHAAPPPEQCAPALSHAWGLSIFQFVDGGGA